jgi:7-cyano-7-deazaguanine reductase
LRTSLAAARSGKADVALGNIIGSNIFNILGILGVTALIHPFSVMQNHAGNIAGEAMQAGGQSIVSSTDIGALVLSLFFLFLFGITGKKIAALGRGASSGGLCALHGAPVQHHSSPGAASQCLTIRSIRTSASSANRPPSRKARKRRSWSACRTPHAGTLYLTRFVAPEFTSICPVTGQPDFAHLVIDYAPGEWLVESKSLKLYLTSFRNHGAFHEDCTVSIGKRIFEFTEAKWLRISGYWYPRGGIPIDVFWQSGDVPAGLYVPDTGVAPYRGRG